MVEVNQWLQDIDPKGSSRLEEEWIGGSCRSQYPLSKPSKRCKNHRREGIGSKLKGFSAMVVKNMFKHWGRSPFYRRTKYDRLGGKRVAPNFYRLFLFGTSAEPDKEWTKPAIGPIGQNYWRQKTGLWKRWYLLLWTPILANLDFLKS
jgi:hypothetical protein